MKYAVKYLPSRRHRKPRELMITADDELSAIILASEPLLDEYDEPVVLNAFPRG